MPSYKLHYLNLRGRAESIRILLSLAGADWEDVRVADFEDFTRNMKPSGICPYGQVPILEVNETVLGQSMAILRFIAKEHGFAPTTPLQMAVADGIVDQVQDCVLKLIKIWIEKDPMKKEELIKDTFGSIFPQNMKYFEKILTENSGGNTFIFGDKITYADVHLFDFINNYIAHGKLEVPDMLKDFPGLTKLYNAVMNEPKVIAFLKTRPETEL